MSRRGGRALRALGGALLLVTGACSPEPVAVLTGLEIVIAEGDEQFGTVGQTLTTPLRAVVRTEATQVPQEAVSVQWTVESGDARFITSASTTTNDTGSVEAIVQLGAAAGDVAVRASIVNQVGATVTFSLHTVEPPVLTTVSPANGLAGDTITVEGMNFSPVPDQDVVLFSGIRGRVVAATPTELRGGGADLPAGRARRRQCSARRDRQRHRAVRPSREAGPSRGWVSETSSTCKTTTASSALHFRATLEASTSASCTRPVR